MNLYELGHNFIEVQHLIDEGAEGLEDTLEAIQASREDKYQAIVHIIRNAEAAAEAFKNEAARLTDKRKVEENKVARLKKYLEESLIATGSRKEKAGLFTVAIQKSPPSLNVIDESFIPVGYFEPQPDKLNRKELLEDLKQGDEVRGAEIVQGEHLRIR